MPAGWGDRGTRKGRMDACDVRVTGSETLRIANSVFATMMRGQALIGGALGLRGREPLFRRGPEPRWVG